MNTSSLGLDPTRRAREIEHDDDLPVPAQAAERRPAPREIAELPALPDTDGALYARAARSAGASSARPTLAMAVRVEDVGPTYSPIAQRLDVFVASCTPTFKVHDADGVTREVRVEVAFRLKYVPPKEAGKRNERLEALERVIKSNEGTLTRVTEPLGLRGQVSLARVGRASPKALEAIVQALIDSGHLAPRTPEHFTLEQRIRATMTEFGVGLDCAGFAQQAFLASRAIESDAVARASAGLRADIADEDLSHLPASKFARVSPLHARAGDLVVLRPPQDHEYGHTAIVRSAMKPTDEDIAILGKTERELVRELDRARLVRLEIDASWGSGGLAELGGVQRQVWWHDGKHWVSGGELASGPYRHQVQGFYRPKGE